MAVEMNLAGLDIGTTGCKMTVFTQDGEYVGSVHRDYPVRRQNGVHEVDGAAIWDAVRYVIGTAAADYGVKAIGVTSFGEAFVMLDERDTPLCPAILYTDPRGADECDRLVEEIGAEQITRVTGVKPHSMYSLPKLMWLKKHRPDLFAQARRVMLVQDYVVYRLTGKAQIDYSVATRTMAFDIHKLGWSTALCDAAGIDIGLLSKPVPTGTSAGKPKREVALALGLAEDCAIVTGGHDQVAAAVGSGVFDDSATVDGAGTVECLTPVFSQYDPAFMASSNFCIVPYCEPGRYVCYAFCYTGGALVKWFVDNLAGNAVRSAAGRGVSVYEELEQAWNGRPTGLLVLPHFAGAATPYMDAGSKGAIVGLTVDHSQSDIYLGLMEGVCYEMLLNMEHLAQAGVPVRHLRATGGGANSRVWLQMKADVLNVPVTALRTSEAGTTGSAMLAGVAVGVFGDLDQAAANMVGTSRTFLPRDDAHQAYSAVYERYRHLYAAIRPLV